MKDDTDHKNDVSLVTIFATSDLSKLAIIKSMLESEGIPYHVKGEQIQSLFGLGGITPVNPITGPVEVQVSSEDEHGSRELLADIIEEQR